MRIFSMIETIMEKMRMEASARRKSKPRPAQAPVFRSGAIPAPTWKFSGTSASWMAAQSGSQ